MWSHSGGPSIHVVHKDALHNLKKSPFDPNDYLAKPAPGLTGHIIQGMVGHSPPKHIAMVTADGVAKSVVGKVILSPDKTMTSSSVHHGSSVSAVVTKPIQKSIGGLNLPNFVKKKTTVHSVTDESKRMKMNENRTGPTTPPIIGAPNNRAVVKMPTRQKTSPAPPVKTYERKPKKSKGQWLQYYTLPTANVELSQIVNIFRNV